MWTPPQVVRLIVGENIAVFRALLSEERLQPLHLDVVADEGEPTAVWLALVECALDHGYSVEDVTMAWFLASRAWWGPGSTFWEGFQAKFVELAGSRTDRVSEVALLIAENCARRATAARVREKNEAVYGR